MLLGSSMVLAALPFFIAIPLIQSIPFNLPNSECECFILSGNKDAQFKYHDFWDFRNLKSEEVGSNFTAPAPVAAGQDRGTESPTSTFFKTSPFMEQFFLGTSHKNLSDEVTVRMVNSPQNVYLDRDDADSPVHLTLRTNRLRRFQSASNIESYSKRFLYASIRLRARVSGPAGACAAVFLYANDTQESDMEILTRDSDSLVHATNQPGMDANGSVIQEATTEFNITEGIFWSFQRSWTEWNDYQVDWLPEQSRWWVNGRPYANNTYGVPREPSNFQISMWGDGGPWVGKMAIGGLATLDIEWIDMVYNLSNQNSVGLSCKNVCNVDNVGNDFNPVLVS